MKNHVLVSLPAVAAALLYAQHSQAQDKETFIRLVNPDPRTVAAYWTPERLEAAKPPTLQVAPVSGMQANPVAAPSAAMASSNARAPALTVRPAVRRLFTPESQTAQARSVAAPHAGNNLDRASYTSTRVFPMFDGAAAPYSADRAYPYITVGKLFFTAGARPLFCSASVIQHRIVVTAGHCVHSGTASGYFSNWMFVPAFRDGAAPLLTWNWRAAIVTNTWATGGGTVPNSADYAMIEFADQPVGGTLRSLGDVTGWLGWQTLSLQFNHTSKLGYPCNLDSCQKMQNVMSDDVAYAPDIVWDGSDAGAGTDGGPWVQNFQVLQAGGGTDANSGSNRVVGVTSSTGSLGDAGTQSSAIPDGRWIDLFNAMCALRTGNCL